MGFSRTSAGWMAPGRSAGWATGRGRDRAHATHHAATASAADWKWWHQWRWHWSAHDVKQWLHRVPIPRLAVATMGT